MECFKCNLNSNETSNPLIDVCNCKTDATFIHRDCIYDSITSENCKTCESKFHLNNLYSLFLDDELDSKDDKFDIEKSDELTEYSEDFITGEISDTILSDNVDKIDNTDIIQCKSCKQHTVYEDYTAGYMVCINCGITTTELIDDTAEWRFYNSEDNKNGDPSRCGCPSNPFLPKSSLGTNILSYNKQLTRTHNWGIMDYNETSLNNTFEDIKLKCYKNNIPQIVINSACHYAHLIKKSKVITRGKNRIALHAAAVFVSCQKHEKSYTPTDIAKIFKINVKDITQGYKKFCEIMGNTNNLNSLVNDVDNLTAINYVDRFCKKIKFNSKYTEISKYIASQIDNIKINWENKNKPLSLASGCILLTATEYNLPVSKKDVSDICEVSPVTVNKIHKKLLEHIDELLPPQQFINQIADDTIEFELKMNTYDLS